MAVIADDGRVPPALLRSAVAYVRSAPEIVRAVVVSPRAAAIQADVSPAHAFAVELPETGTPPSLELLSRVAGWAERAAGEPMRLILMLDPRRPIEDPLVIYECLQRLLTNGLADGIVGVRRGGSGPGWEQAGEWLAPAEAGKALAEDPSLYVFRRAFVDHHPADWRAGGRFLPYEIVPINR